MSHEEEFDDRLAVALYARSQTMEEAKDSTAIKRNVVNWSKGMSTRDATAQWGIYDPESILFALLPSRTASQETSLLVRHIVYQLRKSTEVATFPWL